MKMQRNVSLEQNLLADFPGHAFEGASVNVLGLRYKGEQTFHRPITEPHTVEKRAVSVQFYSLPEIIQILFISGTVANLVSPQFPAHSFGQREFDAHLTTSLAWMAFTREALKDSRPMTDWERETAAEIFWAEFE